MDDKLFCVKCGYRIWRHSDGKPVVDQYFQNQHMNCRSAMRFILRYEADGQADYPYAERELVKGEGHE